MTRIIFMTTLALCTASTAMADSPAHSRAMQIAKRVATMENSRDLPSRAVWLSNRVIRNSRELASYTPEKKNSKRPAAIKN